MRWLAARPRFLAALALGIALLPWSAPVGAAGTPIPHGTVELVAENQWIAPGRAFYLGLHFQLEKGWHIYWVNPGDSGEPPRVAWQLPAGLTAGLMEWPTPRRLGSSSVTDFGYDHPVLLPVPIRASASLPTRPAAQVGAEVKVMVCREMCVAGKAQLSLALPVKPQPPEPDLRTQALFADARKWLPRPAPASWKLSVSDARDSFVLTVGLGHRVMQAVFFPLVESAIDNAAPQEFRPSAGGFRLTLRKSERLVKPIERLKGILVLSADQAYVIDAPVGNASAAKQ